MKQELLELMKCPYCGTGFEIEEVYSENEEEIISGCIKCECDTYPILEGIFILKKSPQKKYIVEYLKKKENQKAIALSLGFAVTDICRVADIIEPKLCGKFFKNSLLNLVNYLSKKRSRRYSDKNISFYEALGNKYGVVYFKHRFSSQTFWSLYPVIPVLSKKRKRVLDMCCGAGHASFVISKYVNPDELICVDGDFRSLYLAKKYFSNAEFINIDANYQLPFKDDIFSSVFMMDAFHYVDARALLAKEFERVLSKEGLLLLLHLHNAQVENVAAGKPLSPSTWKSLFDLDVTAMPEKSIVEDFILRDRLDLSKRYSEEELNLSDAVLMIGGADLDCFDGIWKYILEIRDNLIINPIYKMKKEGDMILLEREFPSESFRKEYPLTEKYLPERCIIDNEGVMKALEGREVNMNRISEENLKYIEELMMKFVIINVPRKYI